MVDDKNCKPDEKLLKEMAEVDKAIFAGLNLDGITVTRLGFGEALEDAATHRIRIPFSRSDKLADSAYGNERMAELLRQKGIKVLAAASGENEMRLQIDASPHTAAEIKQIAIDAIKTATLSPHADAAWIQHANFQSDSMSKTACPNLEEANCLLHLAREEAGLPETANIPPRPLKCSTLPKGK